MVTVISFTLWIFFRNVEPEKKQVQKLRSSSSKTKCCEKVKSTVTRWELVRACEQHTALGCRFRLKARRKARKQKESKLKLLAWQQKQVVSTLGRLKVPSAGALHRLPRGTFMMHPNLIRNCSHTSVLFPENCFIIFNNFGALQMLFQCFFLL